MLQVFLIIVGASASIFILLWIVVYALQFVRSDTPNVPSLDPHLLRRAQLKAGKTTPIWFSEIRMLDRERVLVGGLVIDYEYQERGSLGLPDVWLDDLYRRQN